MWHLMEFIYNCIYTLNFYLFIYLIYKILDSTNITLDSNITSDVNYITFYSNNG